MAGSVKEEALKLRQNIDKVYDAAKQAEYDSFWDVFQSNGTRTHYNYGISGQGWTADNFKPKYDISPTTATGMFYSSTINGDLVQILEECGVNLDFSKATSISSLFNSNYYITRIGVMDCTNATSLSNAYSYCSGLETIDKIILKNDGSQSFNQTFISCTKLSEIRFEGEIGKNDLNVQWSNNLTIESLRSIINCLADKSADTSGTEWVVTVGSTNYAKLTTEDLAEIQSKGWYFR